MKPFLREPLTYDEKLDKDDDRRIDRIGFALFIIGGFLGTVVIWLIYNGKLWP